MEKINLKVPLDNIESILGTVTSPSIVLAEIIKNSIDSNAKTVTINIFDKEKKQLIIIDDGDGFTLEDIKNLGLITESNKKINGNLYRKDGDFFAGSKGLGILSLFSISTRFTMETERNKERYRILWAKGLSSFTYERINYKNKNGTTIVIEEMDDEYLTILTDENELNKLKHLSIKNYVTSSLDSKNIIFLINDKLCTQLEVSSIDNLRNKFKGSVKFRYDSKTNLLRFQYFFDNDLINKNEIIINLSNEVNIPDILTNTYNLSQVTYKGKTCKYLNFSLDSFSGEMLVTEKRNKDIDLLNFGEGVRVFVNQFAMYGYLDRENDWLNLSVFSLQRKNTRYKPHNVFGYVHFENFNENKSYLKISNERAYFIENGAYKKFEEIMKNIITTLAFNIDVAERNKLFYNNLEKEAIAKKSVSFKKSGHINQDKQINNENSSTQTNPLNSSNKEVENNAKNSIANPLPKKDNNENISNNQPLTNGETATINDSQTDISKNTKNVEIEIDKKPKFNFFNTSNIIKSPGKIEIEYHELISQLRKLDYKKFYLIYGIAFRAILEDISKTYLNTRGIQLCSDFGQNIRLMTDDILQIIKNPMLINSTDKAYIENILGGYNAFKNFFQVTGSDFYDNGKQGIKATKLNSFVHSPRWMEIEEAENIANNIILPLYIISKEIINKIKK